MELLERLKSESLKVTPQRVAILNYLDKKTHPTIDDIYEYIKRDFVSISLATIYKNLNTLKDKGIVIEVNTQTGKIKYDLNLKRHIHKFCPLCHEIEDIFLDDILTEFNDRVSKELNEEVLRSDILLTTICKNCK